jgi:hypothetical protein
VEGETVINYGIVNKKAWESVEEFRIGEGVVSEHYLNSFQEAKGRERKGVGDRNKTVYFFICLE